MSLLHLSRRSSGFTLIELMITVAIIGILAGVAYPSYTSYVLRSHRADAQAQMMEIANRQQQFLLANRSYASAQALADSGYALPSSVAARYDYAVSTSSSPPSFTITFTAKGSQSSDGNLTLSSTGEKTPASKW
jgi:type IV pilus assembly protein PilE